MASHHEHGDNRSAVEKEERNPNSPSAADRWHVPYPQRTVTRRFPRVRSTGRDTGETLLGNVPSPVAIIQCIVHPDESDHPSSFEENHRDCKPLLQRHDHSQAIRVTKQKSNHKDNTNNEREREWQSYHYQFVVGYRVLLQDNVGELWDLFESNQAKFSRRGRRGLCLPSIFAWSETRV